MQMGLEWGARGKESRRREELGSSLLLKAEILLGGNVSSAVVLLRVVASPSLFLDASQFLFWGCSAAACSQAVPPSNLRPAPCSCLPVAPAASGDLGPAVPLMPQNSSISSRRFLVESFGF